jgi:hypothetical protein
MGWQDEAQPVETGWQTKAIPVDPPIDIDTSPVPVPDLVEREYGVEGGIIPKFKVAPDTLTQYERDAATRGVDIYSELDDYSLRKALGFSPNDAFSKDFLARKLAEKTGLPAEYLIRTAPTGEIEFYNDETKRFTPVDNTKLTKNDLADLYGPSIAIGTPVASSVVGAFAGPWASVGLGALGALYGEVIRLERGRAMGVHDLTPGETMIEAGKAFGWDLGAGLGGVSLAKIMQLYGKLRRAEALSPEEAKSILDEGGKYADDLRMLNEALESHGRSARYVLDPVADAESMLGLELREAAAKSSDMRRVQRAADLKANESALQDYAKVITGVQVPEGRILSNEGAEAIGREAQIGLRQAERRIEAHFDEGLRAAEDDALRALSELGDATAGQVSGEVGSQARFVVRAYHDALEEAKDSAYTIYANRIGQKLPGDSGFSEAIRYTSNIAVPIDKTFSDYVSAAKILVKKGVITAKAQGADALKPLNIGDKVDLAILDDNIKQLRAINRQGIGDFATRKLNLAENELTRLRNNYLAKNHPDVLTLLKDAEAKNTVFKDFADKSVLAGVIKIGPAGRPVLDDVGVFKHIFSKDDGGEAMRALVNIADKEPGGLFALQSGALRLYKATATARGETLVTRASHDRFIAKYEDALEALFPNDPRITRFGGLADAVERNAVRAKRITQVIAKSEFGKLGHVKPEAMGKATFKENISEKELRRVVNRLDADAPASAAAYRDSVGREIYRRITAPVPVNKIAAGEVPTTSQITTLLNNYGGKLRIIYGPQYRQNLETLARLIRANAYTVPGKEIAQDTIIGRFARAVVSPPLTRRGRVQTWIEALRTEAAHEMLNKAVRDPKALQAIIKAQQLNIKSQKASAVLSQYGGLVLAFDDPLRTDE